MNNFYHIPFKKENHIFRNVPTYQKNGFMGRDDREWETGTFPGSLRLGNHFVRKMPPRLPGPQTQEQRKIRNDDLDSPPSMQDQGMLFEGFGGDSRIAPINFLF
jgi:hypothetical protein